MAWWWNYWARRYFHIPFSFLIFDFSFLLYLFIHLFWNFHLISFDRDGLDRGKNWCVPAKMYDFFKLFWRPLQKSPGNIFGYSPSLVRERRSRTEKNVSDRKERLGPKRTSRAHPFMGLHLRYPIGTIKKEQKRPKRGTLIRKWVTTRSTC